MTTALHRHLPYNGYRRFEKTNENNALTIQMDRFSAEVIHAGNMWKEKFQFLGFLMARYEGCSRIMAVHYTSGSTTPETALIQKIFALVRSIPASHVLAGALWTNSNIVTEDTLIDYPGLLEQVCDLDALLLRAKRIKNLDRMITNYNRLHPTGRSVS